MKKKIEEVIIDDYQDTKPKKSLLKKEVIKAPKTKKDKLIVSLMLVFILLSGILGYIWITTFDWSPVKVLNQEKYYSFELPIVTIVNENSNSRPIAVMINNHADARAIMLGYKMPIWFMK